MPDLSKPCAGNSTLSLAARGMSAPGVGAVELPALALPVQPLGLLISFSAPIGPPYWLLIWVYCLGEVWAGGNYNTFASGTFFSHWRAGIREEEGKMES